MNTLENAIENIITKINHHFEKGGFFRENGATARYYKIASCDYPNWDIDEHYALLVLHRNPPGGLEISYSINYGVYDWVIQKF